VGAGQPVRDQLELWAEADTPLAETLAISGDLNMLSLMERVLSQQENKQGPRFT